MKSSAPTLQRLTGLGLIALPLLTEPVISLPRGLLLGLPAQFVYLFAVWGGLLLIAATFSEREGP